MDRKRAAAEGLLPLDRCRTDTQWLVNFANYVWSSTQIPAIATGTVLDLGCGPGDGTDYLAARARRAVGVDALEPAIRGARDRYRRPNLQFLVMRGEHLGFEGAVFDGVVCHEVLMIAGSDERVLAEVGRVLNPGGVAIISVPWNPAHREQSSRPAYRREYCWESFRTLLGRHFAAVTFYRRCLGERLRRVEGELSLVRQADPFGLRGAIPRRLRHAVASVLARLRGLPALGELSTDDVEYFEGTGPSLSLIAVCGQAQLPGAGPI